MTVATIPATASELLGNLLDDAITMAAGGFASAADIDTAMRLGAGHPLGPFAYLATLPGGARPGAPTASEPAEVVAGAVSEGGQVALLGPVGVLGTGHMASGIVECLAQVGRAVVVLSRGAAATTRLTGAVESRLRRSVDRGRLDARAAEDLRARIRCTSNVGDLATCGLVVEAVAEDLEVKRTVLETVEPVLAPAAVIATNTSSLRVAEVTAGLPTGRGVLALHFFNPAPAMKLVEVVVPEMATGRDSLVAAGCAFARSLGKTPVTCGDERGFIVNRLLIPYLNDAVAVVRRGMPAVAVDAMIRGQAQHPMGPLALVDLIGVDVTVAALGSLHEATRSQRTAPDPLLLDLLERGHLGRKTGRGFHAYGA